MPEPALPGYLNTPYSAKGQRGGTAIPQRPTAGAADCLGWASVTWLRGGYRSRVRWDFFLGRRVAALGETLFWCDSGGRRDWGGDGRGSDGRPGHGGWEGGLR